MMQKYLILSDEYIKASPEVREACYNGMGAEWMTEFSRDVLDFLFRVLENGVRVHDVDFSLGRKTKKRFHAANERMRRNFELLAKNEIPWYRWHKKRRFLKYWIPLMYKAVESEGGWKAFKEGKPPVLKPKVF